jgi:cell division protease FtsH
MEIKRLVDEGYGEARRILEQMHSDLERLANGLLECETLSGGQIVELLERGDRTAEGRKAALPALSETNERKLH